MDKILDNFEDAIDLNPKESSAYFGYARANAKMGCVENAISAYEKAVSLSPGNAEYVKELNNYRKLNDIVKDNMVVNNLPKEQTEMQSQSVLQNTIPGVNANIQPDAEYKDLLSKGDEAYSQQKYNEAIDCYTKAVVYNPADKNTMLKIANIYTYFIIMYNNNALF